jgi:hypothetical protein
MNVIPFPGRVKRPSRSDEQIKGATAMVYDDDDETERRAAAKHERYAKWNKWQRDKRNWGGGLFKPGGANPNAIATFDIDRTAWREFEYRRRFARAVVELLFTSGVIAIGNAPPFWLLKKVGNEYRHMSDRMIVRCLNEYVSFTRQDGQIPVKPPSWLVETMRLFASYDIMSEMEDH